jgi:hypothetical protein
MASLAIPYVRGRSRLTKCASIVAVYILAKAFAVNYSESTLMGKNRVARGQMLQYHAYRRHEHTVFRHMPVTDIGSTMAKCLPPRRGNGKNGGMMAEAALIRQHYV